MGLFLFKKLSIIRTLEYNSHMIFYKYNSAGISDLVGFCLSCAEIAKL